MTLCRYVLRLRVVLRVFFLMIRPPPISTLFPYTTLFRSALTACGAAPPDPSASAGPTEISVSLFGTFGYEEVGLDRKSTRLNSSHANISYAVFCLKKKNPTRPCSSDSKMTQLKSRHSLVL